MELIEMAEVFFSTFLEVSIQVLEAIGAVMIIFAALRSLWGVISKKPHTGGQFLQMLSTALGFLLAGEILHTVIVRDWKDLVIVGAVIVMRVIITMLIHWEMRQEQAHADGKQH